ncbi:hypothetical protein B0T25DRAFT_557977 [Lasiosphaeria hispida]|uniref:Uncharacterized protein n=1 Tax=Lasiosphaeria hispida TaxID=260671 RepID=A0AAJ0H623_9PEZI|nr:hypothetical protein B0T25DRAFT_557977 [Lasiosphaeria hispida]
MFSSTPSASKSLVPMSWLDMVNATSLSTLILDTLSRSQSGVDSSALQLGSCELHWHLCLRLQCTIHHCLGLQMST